MRRALILGGANTLHDDMAGALDLFTPDLIIACNHAARDHEGPVDHWASMHPELMPMWIRDRAKKGLPAAGRYWFPRHKPSPIKGTPLRTRGGSSGMLCVEVARALECTHAVLAGIPLVKTARHFDDHRHWGEARQYWPAWERQKPNMENWVRSMSGFTRDLLGKPTREWLNADSS